ncbi:transcription factor HES-1-like isoform X2 [Brachyhypopomus gauderio]|uniref:transcription factor HES-1-like isoform X2 n=1 Tax=Brachyhypopomus gauderio TaxID=698409 RepID=UPI00404346EC
MPDDISEKITFTATPIHLSPRAHNMRLNMFPEKPRTTPDHRKTSRHSKLEKADILEMTVKHLKSVQHARKSVTSWTHQPPLGKYGAGFSACMNEVTRFMSTCDGASGELGRRLIAHLNSCVSPATTRPSARAPPPAASPASLQPSDAPFKNGAIIIPPENGNLHGGFRVVQTSNGAFALLIPSSPGTNISVQHSSARPVALCPSARDSVWRPW